MTEQAQEPTMDSLKVEHYKQRLSEMEETVATFRAALSLVTGERDTLAQRVTELEKVPDVQEEKPSENTNSKD